MNETTPWTDLTVGSSDIISWTPPVDISGRVDIVLESRSDQSFQMKSDSNSAWLVLDNDNPIIMSSIPANEDYVNSVSEREISLLLADTSGFENESMSLEIWVQGLDDGSDGSIPDAIAQDTEYRIVNHTLENNGSLWWFNCTWVFNAFTNYKNVQRHYTNYCGSRTCNQLWLKQSKVSCTCPKWFAY